MGDVKALLHQAQSATPPLNWKIHRIPHPSLVSILVMSTLGALVISCVVGNLFAYLLSLLAGKPGYASFTSDQRVMLAVLGAVLLYVIYRVVREWTFCGLVVITEHEVIEYLSIRRFEPIRILDFSAIQGMALQRRDAEADTGAISTTYCLAIRDTRTKEYTWSLDVRFSYVYTSPLAVPVYEDIIAQFERMHTNANEGLSTHRRTLDYRFIK